MTVDWHTEVLDLVATVGRRLPTGTLESMAQAIESGAEGRALEQRVAAFMTQGSLRNLMLEALRRWPETGADFRSLAWALRSAGHVDQLWRDFQDLEVVWTGPDPRNTHLRRTHQAILEVIQQARRDLWLVSFAGYPVPAIGQALQKAIDRGVDVKFLVEDPEVSGGKVGVSAIKALSQRQAEQVTVYVWPRSKRETNDEGQHGSQHVKCTLADDERLFVTSANLTGHAMTINMELGTLIRGGEQPKIVGRQFRWMVDEGYLVPIG